VAFEQLRVPHVLCYTLETNHASQRVMEKVGFQFEKQIMHAGLPHVLYRITADEYARTAP
jgi:RimJ/RimL family protein N-acetyltransferase